mmetsp:Transcript_38319/g.95079  ORF Transcript_38319/g.95079 Transcript_38319/m.95079 type:complete len:1065 (-) Transcript_38319:299-3493(-)|eukprot:CAMPEP_0197606574 /NCGR_PEP_ID=MMETSP1326-20131121/45364_1 /TAXON_ID=1155430 /ORGANISM="Genus nov. species nov., Strain RCC2288" /LENGTH=1064 /DNA_ID=CAMNT_0043174505 /DNA_START=130 /DNA_END=3324 /DNA_ORIENTATION=+
MARDKGKAPATEAEGEAAHGNGTILRVKVTNFMCHHNLEVELGPRINFIVGENGSGKSAVLTAMCLALGTNAKKTERSVKGIKGFIREGANFAKLEVSIRNVGPDALDPALYGEVITVERTISASGSAPFKIKSQWGKDVGHSKEHLVRITDHFNIDVDNPIVVMSQDKTREFLHSGKDTDKYKFFVKATLLEDIQHRLAYVKGAVAEMDKLIMEKEDELPRVEQEVDTLQEEADSFQKMEEYLAKVEELRNRLAWADVNEAEVVQSELEERVENHRTTVTRKLEEQLRAQEAVVAGSKAENDEAYARLEAFSARVKLVLEEKAVAQRKSNDCDRAVRKRDTDLRAHDNNIKDKTQTAAALQEAIANARLSVEQQSQAQDASIQRDIADAEERKEGTKVALDELRAREDELLKKVAAANGEEHSMRNGVTALERSAQEADANLRSAEKDDGNQLLKFGRGMPALAKLLQQRAKEFSKPPIGPIGMHIKLKDQQWAQAVEEHFGGFFAGYIVANMADRSKLDKMMRDAGCPPNIHVTNYNVDKYQMAENQLPSAAITTMLDVLEIEHPAVFNVVVDNTGIERVALVPDEGQARKIVYRGPQQAANVKEAYTFQRKLWQRGQTQFENPYRNNNVPRLAVDKTQYILQLRREMETQATEKQIAERRLQDHRRLKDGLNTELKDAKAAKRVAQTQDDAARFAVNEAKSAAAEKAGPAVVDVESLESELKELQGQLNGELKERRDVLVAAKVEAAAAVKEALEEHKAMQAGAAADAEEGTALQERFEAAAGTVHLATEHLHYFQGKTQELAGVIALDERTIEEYKAVVVDKTGAASKVCSRETAQGYIAEGDTEMESTALTNLHERAKRQVEKESRRHARPQEDVMRALADTRRKFKRLQNTLKNAREPCQRLQKGVKTRQKLLSETAKSVNKEVSHRFNYYMAKKGHAGKVVVDYKAATLELDVKMHGQGQTVKDTRSMSGGERSYSTLALTLSLGESIESPFRAMDEFDVFMDAVNRKVSMDALIAFARDPFNLDKQFLFITPQDISAVDATASDIKVQKMKAARPA